MEKYKTEFGYFIRQKGLDLEKPTPPTKLAQQLGITRKYLDELEKCKKPAPEQELLTKMVEVYKLDEDDQELLFKLAKESQAKFAHIETATPLLDYQESVREALKVAIENSAPKEKWKKFAKEIKNQSTGREHE